MRLDDPFTTSGRPSRTMPAVCALKHPMEKGQIFVIGKYRYIVQEEITRGQFDEYIAKYREHPAGVAGSGIIGDTGSIEKETFESGMELKFEPEHYYTVKVEMATGEIQMCHCGQPLHYSHPDYYEAVQGMIDLLGEFVQVMAKGKTWLVPRHYIALHGLKAETIHLLGFEEAPHES